VLDGCGMKTNRKGMCYENEGGGRRKWTSLVLANVAVYFPGIINCAVKKRKETKDTPE
jgi:hypothetical protein